MPAGASPHARRASSHFSDILDFLPDAVNSLCQRDDVPNEVLKKRILACRTKPSAFCVRCRAACAVSKSDIHWAGTPCQDSSTFNIDRRHFEGPRAKVFWTWAAMVQTLKFPIVFHENVIGFGLKEFQNVLPIYLVVRLEVDPKREGWATARRRQIICAVLRCWVNHVICDVSNNDALEEYMGLRAAYESFFTRTCGFTWHDYMVGTEGDVESCKQWALGRAEVKKRHMEKSLYKDDSNDSLFACTTNERRRADMYAAIAPHEVCDLGQDPRHRPVHSSNGVLHTAIAGMGLMYSFPHRRFVVPSELLLANGWPVTDASSAAVGGAICLFDPTRPGPPTRTRASVLRQLGNSQHVNSVGVCTLFAVLTFETLGMRSRDHGDSDGSSGARGFATAFCKRMRRV